MNVTDRLLQSSFKKPDENFLRQLVRNLHRHFQLMVIQLDNAWGVVRCILDIIMQQKVRL